MKSASFSLVLAFSALLFVAPTVEAATIVPFSGNLTGSLAQGSLSIVLSGNSLTGTLTNTSPVDARVMGFGFDLAGGNLNGFTGSANAGFVFSDGNFGNVPQFNGTTIDFGFAVNCVDPPGNPGQQCTLNGGGSPNNGLAPSQIVTFSATGPFGSLTEQQVAAALYVRFQRVSGNITSDVARPIIPTTTVPEPASMILLGTGLLAASRAAKRRQATK